MRRESHAELTILGTFAIHVAIGIIAVAIVRAYPPAKDKPAPSIDLVDVDPPPPPPPPAPVLPAVEEHPQPAPEPPPEPVHAKVAIRSTAPAPTHTEPPPTPTPSPSPDSGGGPVVHIDNLAPDAKGSVPVARSPSSPHVGRGGSGGGTGAGSGQGSSDAPPPPVSVAMIKKAAMPRGDFGYMDASKDYPAEARQLGIEGDIQVRLVVDDHGAVKSAILRTKLGHGLDELALARARKLQFDPAVDTDNKPVASVVVWTFHMTLPK